MKLSLRLIAFVVLAAISSFAAERGVMMREAILYLAPNTTSEKLANVARGREVVVLERPKGWVHVLATISQTFGADRDISGWIQDKGMITATTPNGDSLLYGEAVDSENEASRRGGRKNAAQDAMRLYARTAEYFPNSAIAGEALYRAADIRWQLDKDERSSRSSARKRDPGDRIPIEEDAMKQVMKKFPRTKWADLAAFHLIDNKLCGDWQAQSKCPEKEASVYEDYVKDHPTSPAVPEALYNAAFRYGALVQLYGMEGQASKIKSAEERAIATAQRVAQVPNVSSDWAARARRLAYMVENNIPTFGNNID
ncbi:MAG TPA: hypothetical protein VN622_02340 [Clostridia bacterium]|nr:hypothetical protein [Clostridia bacterium]